MVYFVLNWWVPALGDWVKVGTYGSLENAEGGQDVFTNRMREHWVGPIKTSIVRVENIEVSK